MCNKAILWSIDLRGMSPADRSILTLLAIHKNQKTGACFPSIDLLSMESGWCEKTVRNSIKHLEKNGRISVDKVNKSNHYQLLIPVTATGIIEKDTGNCVQVTGNCVHDSGNCVPVTGNTFPDTGNSYPLTIRTVNKQKENSKQQQEAVVVDTDDSESEVVINSVNHPDELTEQQEQNTEDIAEAEKAIRSLFAHKKLKPDTERDIRCKLPAMVITHGVEDILDGIDTMRINMDKGFNIINPIPYLEKIMVPDDDDDIPW